LDGGDAADDGGVADADAADAAGCGTSCCPGSGDVWWDTAWLNRAQLIFDNSASAVNLANFPVLVSPTATEITYASTQTNGEDIRFVDASGATVLAHEIEQWNRSAETSAVWVNVPQIDAASTTDYIWIYYNNSGASDAQNAAAVWDVSYQGVYHLGEDRAGVGTADVYEDSTSNVNHGDDEVSETGQAGQIANGQEFDGAGDYIDVGSVGDDIDVTKGTVSGWVELNSSSTTSNLFNAQVGAGNVISLAWTFDDSGFWMKYRAGAVDTSVIVPAGPLIDEDDGEQHFVAMTWDETADEVKVFIEGAQYGGTQTGLGTWSGSIAGASIGYNIVQRVGYLDGMIDEVRVSSTARSADWIEASYLSQNGTFAFITYCNESLP